jgi:choline dehydrogenase-like flavoprotein
MEDGTMGVSGMLVVLTQPASSGSVAPSSADPRDPPLLDAGYLTDADGSDVARLSRAVKFAMGLAHGINQSGYTWMPASVPGRDAMSGAWTFEGHEDVTRDMKPTDFLDPHLVPDAAVEAYVRRHARAIYHGTSTCAMTARSERKLGVDPETLSLDAVRGLRVCDASVFPAVPSTHPQSLVVAMAEKLARQMRSE